MMFNTWGLTGGQHKEVDWTDLKERRCRMHCFLCRARGAGQRLYSACDWALLTICWLIMFRGSNCFNTDLTCAEAEVRPEALRSRTGSAGNSTDLNIMFSLLTGVAAQMRPEAVLGVRLGAADNAAEAGARAGEAAKAAAGHAAAAVVA